MEGSGASRSVSRHLGTGELLTATMPGTFHVRVVSRVVSAGDGSEYAFTLLLPDDLDD